MRNRILLSLALATSACGQKSKDTSGGDGASAKTERAGGMTVAGEADLPDCNENSEGALVYVQDAKNFRACTSGDWAVIDLSGKDGAHGTNGVDGVNGKDATNELQAAIDLYKKSRKSIFRVEMTCSVLGSPGPNCPAGNTFLGSAFLCGDKKVCTNAHVTSCDPNCYSGVSGFKMYQTVGDTDSVNEGSGMVTPFFDVSDDSTFSFHDSKDLAIVTIPSNPGDATPLTLSETTAGEVVTTFSPIMSLSFPLGFMDLYSDVGYVNSPELTECDAEGGQSGYGCPKEFYAFSTTNDTDHGSSGSPLFDLKSGKVVGVTTAGTNDENANYTWATDASLYKDVP